MHLYVCVCIKASISMYELQFYDKNTVEYSRKQEDVM